MSVDARISGFNGYVALVNKYGVRQVNQWRKRGGRRRERTLAEIKAASEPRRARSSSTRRARPAVTSAPAENAGQQAAPAAPEATTLLEEAVPGPAASARRGGTGR